MKLFKNLTKPSDVEFWKKKLMTMMMKFYDYISYTLRIEQLNCVKNMPLNDLLTDFYVRDLFKNDLMHRSRPATQSRFLSICVI